MEIRKYRYIDALRWWAVLWVLAVHLFQSGAPYIWFLADLWARGVQLFYLVSACTLFLSMSKRTKRETHPFIFFFIRRFFRIAPLFYACILYYIFIRHTEASWLEILSVATFTNWFSPYWIWHLVEWQWSIAIEMMFYLFVPFLFLKINTKEKALIMAYISFVVSGLFILYLQLHPMIPEHLLWTHYLFYFLPAQVPIFFLGILLYFLIREHDHTPESIQKRNRIWIWIGFLWLIAIIFFSLSSTFLGFSNMERWVPYYCIVFFISIILMIWAYFLSLRPYKLFVNGIIEYVWKISFSMYLTHFIALYYLNSYLWPLEIASFHSIFSLILASLTHFLLLIWGTVLISSVTYYAIESPWQLVGKKIIAYLSRKDTISE